MKKIANKSITIIGAALIALILSIIALAVVVTTVNGNGSNKAKAAQTEISGKTFTSEENVATQKKFTTFPQTYEAVFKIADGQPKESVIFGNFRENWEWCDEGLNVKVGANGKPSLYIDNGSNTYTAEFNTEVDTDEWVHLAITHNTTSGIVECFVNGVSQGTSSVLSGRTLSSEILSQRAFMVGGDYGRYNARYFKGSIASVAVFSDIRTPSEIQSDYASGVSASTSDLMCLYDFSSVSGEQVQDKSGNGYDLSDLAYLTSSVFSSNKEYTRVSDFAYSFAVVGDTQRMSEKYPDGLNSIYDWIVNNQRSEKIEFVFGMGDITEQSLVREWDRAKSAIAKLTKANIPYSLVRGNHDMKNDYSGDNTRQGINSAFANNASYINQFDGFMVEGDVTNSYRAFTVQGIKYLLLTLDYGASDAMLEWAGTVVDRYPDHKVIITTHAYEYYAANKLGTDPGKGSPPATDNDYDYKKNPTNTNFRDYNNGVEIWNEFAKKHGNVFLILSGHIDSDTVVYHQESGIHGNLVTSILVNYQQSDTLISGGLGMVNLLKFSKDGTKIYVESYSTVKKAYYKNISQFVIDVPNTTYSAHSVSKYSAYQDADCTHNAVQRGVCSVCGVTHYKEIENTALGHIINGKTTIVSPATCTTNALGSGLCAVCGETGTKELKNTALGHDFGKFTCKDSQCSRCTTVRAKTTEHAFDDGVVTTQPTTENTGVKTYTCADCGETKTESIAKLPTTQQPETNPETNPESTPTTNPDDGKGCATIMPFGGSGGFGGGLAVISLAFALFAIALKLGKRKIN